MADSFQWLSFKTKDVGGDRRGGRAEVAISEVRDRSGKAVPFHSSVAASSPRISGATFGNSAKLSKGCTSK